MDATEQTFLEAMAEDTALEKEQELAQRIAGFSQDRISGQPDLDHIQRTASQLLPKAPEKVERLIELIRARPDIETFDFQSLIVEPETQWTLELVYAGHADTDGEPITVDFETGNATPGARAKYSYRCLDEEAGLSMSHVARYRQASLDPADLTAARLIEFLRAVIVHPVPPATPWLPECLLLPPEVTESLLEGGLRSFLDSLPAPFTWRNESDRDRPSRFIWDDLQKRIEQDSTLRLMKAHKEKGNSAFQKRNHKKAIRMYTKAITTKGTEEGLFMGVFAGQEEERKKLSAICYSNRAAAYLLPGDGLDPVQAIKDAEQAEKLDPTFKKAYFRQARGYTMLNERTKAKEVFSRALARKELAKDPDLLKALALLQLDGLKLSSKADQCRGNEIREGTSCRD